MTMSADQECSQSSFIVLGAHQGWTDVPAMPSDILEALLCMMVQCTVQSGLKPYANKEFCVGLELTLQLIL